jgi:hypothetical protein
VTVCIAAIVNRGQYIVTASDQKICVDAVSSSADEAALKIWAVHPNWVVMFAGGLEHVAPILRQVGAELSGREPTYEEVKGALVRAYQKELQEEETNVVLSRYGLTMEEFLETGSNRFGSAEFARLMTELSQIYLGPPDGLSFLAAGYASSAGAHIFSVSHPGKVENHDVIGFWAIGSGQHAALASLFFHSYNKEALYEEALYRVCEAKFMAEKSAGVGQATSVLILEPDPDWEEGEILQVKGYDLPEPSIQDVRNMWEKEGMPRQPNELYERMRNFLGTTGWTIPVFLGFRKHKENGMR